MGCIVAICRIIYKEIRGKVEMRAGLINIFAFQRECRRFRSASVLHPAVFHFCLKIPSFFLILFSILTDAH